MAMFLVVTEKFPFPEDAVQRLQAAFPDNQKVTENAWALRCDAKTSKEVVHAVFPPDEKGRGPRTLVVRFDAYGGYHQPAMWEWLSKPQE